MNRRRPWLMACLLAVLGCASNPVGGERQPCSPSGECFTGLTCLSDVCVRAPMGGGSAMGGGVGGGMAAGGAAGGTSAGVFDQSNFDTSTWQ
jgi:hypothetical protein